VGTAQSYLNEDEQRERNPHEHIYRLYFEKLVENSLDVVRVFCLMFCGPFIMIECLLSVVYYMDIINGCSAISDSLTNIMVYVLIIFGCISVTVTAFCCYLSVVVGKEIKECWP